MTKNSKSRIIQPAPQVMDILRCVKSCQMMWKLQGGVGWENTMNLVFINSDGCHLTNPTIRKHFKDVAHKTKLDNLRFHDLRHTFATLSLQNGTDIKTVSDMMGHATVSFTMDRYGHVTDVMRQNDSDRMTQLISNL